MSKVVATNRKARHDYQIIETYEAGIELKGNEVKSLRTKGCVLNDSFASIERGELLLYNTHIPEFEKSSFFKSDPKRTRRLLVHKKEIRKLAGLIAQKGLTFIPLKVYFNQRGLAKVELALARGKHTFDKRRKLKEKAAEKDIRRVLKRFNR